MELFLNRRITLWFKWLLFYCFLTILIFLTSPIDRLKGIRKKLGLMLVLSVNKKGNTNKKRILGC